MNQTAMILSIVSILGCLFLATRNSEIRNMGMGKTLRLALIWAAIIITLVVVIHLTGLRVAP